MYDSFSFEGLEISKEISNTYVMLGILSNIGATYSGMNQLENAKKFLQKYVAVAPTTSEAALALAGCNSLPLSKDAWTATHEKRAGGNRCGVFV